MLCFVCYGGSGCWYSVLLRLLLSVVISLSVDVGAVIAVAGCCYCLLLRISYTRVSFSFLLSQGCQAERPTTNSSNGLLCSLIN